MIVTEKLIDFVYCTTVSGGEGTDQQERKSPHERLPL